MLLGVIADDFTGAGDIANTLAREGMQTRLFVGVGGDASGCDAGVIALKSRSLSADEAVRQSLHALAYLQAAGCRQIVFKYCSTFDSTPRGNIGPVAEALAAALDVRGVVVCPAFPGTGRTVFQGHLFVGDRLLSESGMERHPLTPMTDPDLRRWLARQSREEPGHIPLATVRCGAEALHESLRAQQQRLVIVDAIDETDLRTIGGAVADAPLVTGGSGVALGLPQNFRAAGLLGQSAARFAANDGPGLVLSGSCSIATRAQVDRYAAHHPALEIDVASLMEGAPVVEATEAFLADHRSANPLIYSSADPDQVRAVQARYGLEATAERVEALFAGLARHAVDSGFTRIVAAGGETSGAVVAGLSLAELDIGPEIDPGVPALSARSTTGRPLALTLKSGNFGSPDFMAKAIGMLRDG